MSRISDILIRARDTLADPTGDRWSDERLLRLVDEAQKDIVRHAKLLNKKYTTIIPSSTNSISLPDDLMLLTRITVNNEKLDFISRENLDRLDKEWEVNIGTPKNVISDKIGPKELQIYPILEDVDFLPYEFSYVPVDGTIYFTDSTYGVVTYVEFSNIDDFGVVTTIDDGLDGTIDDFGVVTEFTESNYRFTIYYLKRPISITSIDDALEIEDIFDRAIKYYVTGKALRDDMDTQNRVVGNEELGFYTRELEEAIKDKTLDYVTTGKRFEIPYNRAF